MQHDHDRAEHLGRAIQIQSLEGDLAVELVRFARESEHDLIILSLPAESGTTLDERTLVHSWPRPLPRLPRCIARDPPGGRGFQSQSPT